MPALTLIEALSINYDVLGLLFSLFLGLRGSLIPLQWRPKPPQLLGAVTFSSPDMSSSPEVRVPILSILL